MSEDNDLQLLLKELVDRVKSLEAMVYSTDNILMKSGLVKTETQTPFIQTGSALPDADMIAKMDWTELDDMVKKINGE
tara:strand:- start:4922 stop:5155 length:234 start_codon:yes stop_codon:yes gene_type:complete